MMQQIIKRQVNNISIAIQDVNAICTTYKMTKKGFILEFETLSKTDEEKIKGIFGTETKYLNGV
jgi:pyrimidine deaminase RibD-like protein